MIRWMLITGLVLVMCLAWPARAQETTLTIDVDKPHQTMQGFGASGAWWPSWVGDYPQEEQDHLLDLLFTEKGIALSIYRHNIPAGGGSEIRHPERATAKVEPSPGQYDLSADAKSLAILRGVRQRGVERFVLFANSPPGRLTRNGLTSGGEGGGSNLRAGEEGAYATYLLDLATRIREEYQLPHVTLSPINEPQWKWGEKWRGQEGCHYTPEEAAAVIGQTVARNIERKTGIEIEAPESGKWEGTTAYAKAMFADPLIDQHVKQIAIHSYWTDPASRRKEAQLLRAQFPQKELAMTEYCQMQHGHDLSIESGLAMAEVIHDDLTVGNVVSWQWWLAVAGGGYKDGLIYAHPKTRKVDLTKRLWVLGNYSRFVRPGFDRVAATASGEQSLRVTAFASADRQKVVCVVVNTNDEPITKTVTVAGFKATKQAAYVTDATRDLDAFATHGGAFEFPSKSVSTLVLER